MVFAMHCDPALPAGRVGLRAGAITAARDFLTVTLTGAGGHTARPHLSADPIYAAARLITDIPGALSRIVDPRSAVSVIFGQINGGTAHNAIAQTVALRGTVRTTSREAWMTAPEIITRLVESTSGSLGVGNRLVYTRGFPAVVNHAVATELFASAVEQCLGPGAAAGTSQSMGADDFGWYLERIPGALARLGVGIAGRDVDLHSPGFDVDERAIGIGARVLAEVATGALARLGGAGERVAAGPADGAGSRVAGWIRPVV
jgi:amidohydrolase